MNILFKCGFPWFFQILCGTVWEPTAPTRRPSLSITATFYIQQMRNSTTEKVSAAFWSSLTTPKVEILRALLSATPNSTNPSPNSTLSQLRTHIIRDARWIRFRCSIFWWRAGISEINLPSVCRSYASVGLWITSIRYWRNWCIIQSAITPFVSSFSCHNWDHSDTATVICVLCSFKGGQPSIYLLCPS